MGLWKIELDTKDNDSPHLAIVHLGAVYHAVHLLPVYRTVKFISKTITMHSSLDTFKLFYINKFANHHAFANLA
jgi:hypothetical protein